MDASSADSSDAKTLLGRTLVPAALTGFFLFQGWGNEPERRDIGPKDMDAIAQALKNYIQGPAERELSVDVVRRLHWDYLTPTTPPMVMLDTRTCRAGKTVKSNVAVQTFAGHARWRLQDDVDAVLLDKQGAARLREHVKTAAGACQAACILVSPCAFFSADASKTAAQYSRRDTAGREDRDSSQPFSIKILVGALREHRFRTACLLAGDIHYAYQAEGFLRERLGDSQVEVLSFVEVVSSASLNFSSLRALGARKTLRSRLARWFEPSADTAYCAYGDLVDVMIQQNGLPGLGIETSRLKRVFENNNGLITIEGWGAGVRAAPLVAMSHGRYRAGGGTCGTSARRRYQDWACGAIVSST